MSCRTCHTGPPSASCGSCWCADSGLWTSSCKWDTRAGKVWIYSIFYIETLSDWHQPLVTLRPSCTSLMCCLRSEYRLPHTGHARLCFWWTWPENRNKKNFQINKKLHWWCGAPGLSWDSNCSHTRRTCSSSTEKTIFSLSSSILMSSSISKTI